jgi:hypothetical protein
MIIDQTKILKYELFLNSRKYKIVRYKIPYKEKVQRKKYNEKAKKARRYKKLLTWFSLKCKHDVGGYSVNAKQYNIFFSFLHVMTSYLICKDLEHKIGNLFFAYTYLGNLIFQTSQSKQFIERSFK